MERVLELLKARDLVLVSELIEDFSVSEVTVRKDLAELARQGLATRVRGGARATQAGRAEDELAIDVRIDLHAPEKQAIAAAAAAMVGDGEAIALDCSTTAYRLALELKGKKELVVVTNGLLAAEALAATPGIVVVLIGGVLRRASLSTVGDLAGDVLRTTHIKTGFFGAQGLHRERGLMDLNPEEVRLKRALADACETVVGLVDYTKWTRPGLLSFVPSDKVAALVTDTGAPPARVDEWRSLGTNVTVVEPQTAVQAGLSRASRVRGSRLRSA